MSGCGCGGGGTSTGCATCGHDASPFGVGAWARDAATGRYRLAEEVNSAAVGQDAPHVTLTPFARRRAYAIVQPQSNHAGVNVRFRPSTSAPIMPGANAQRGHALLVRQTGVLTPDGEWWVVTTPQGITGFVRAQHLAPAESAESSTDFGPLVSTGGLLDRVTGFLGDSGNLAAMVRRGWDDPAALGRAVGILERADRALAGVVSAGDAVARVRDLAQSIRSRIADLRPQGGASTGQLSPIGRRLLRNPNFRNRLQAWRARERGNSGFEGILPRAVIEALSGVSGLNLRSSPSTDGVLIAPLPNGTTVDVIQTGILEAGAPAGALTRWWQVRWPDAASLARLVAQSAANPGVPFGYGFSDGFIRAMGPSGESFARIIS